MKKLIPTITIITTILSVSCTHHPKPGEIWVYEPDQGPWEDCKIVFPLETVIEVKKGWVKFTQNGRERCESETLFTMSSHKVFDAND